MALEWQERAACSGVFPREEMLMPERRENAARIIAQYCDHCPVVFECADFALDMVGLVGIWGGVHVPMRDHSKAVKALRAKHAMLKSREAA